MINKTRIQLGTLITVANCGQLSHLLSEVLKQFPTKLSAITESSKDPSQSYLCLIPLFGTQEWFQNNSTCGAKLLHNDMMSWQISLFQLVKILLHICLSLPIETTMTDSHFK